MSIGYDLIDIEKEIQQRKSMPVIEFEKPQESIVPVKNQAEELVESAFNQAVVHTVETDEDVQKELLDSASKVIRNKMNSVKARTDQEDKETHFNNKRGACECFGYNETTTDKWAVSVMAFWHNIMTAIWIFIGCFTFAPITFVAKKIKVIFKATWLCVVLALIIYLAVLIIPLLSVWLK